ncbi:MAG: hypothetical protein DRP63_10210 [Planctomycetota bacterium]|nr:MAG: hypothetical protein DRP63_10210 [Planctomycetota bacterium]
MRWLPFLCLLLPTLLFAQQERCKSFVEAINSLRKKEGRLPPLHWDDALALWSPKDAKAPGGRPVWYVIKDGERSLSGLVGDRSAVRGALICAKGKTVEAAFSALMSSNEVRKRVLLEAKYRWRYLHISFEDGVLRMRLAGVQAVGMSAGAWVMLLVGALLLFGGVAFSLAVAGRKRNGA